MARAATTLATTIIAPTSARIGRYGRTRSPGLAASSAAGDPGAGPGASTRAVEPERLDTDFSLGVVVVDAIACSPVPVGEQVRSEDDCGDGGGISEREGRTEDDVAPPDEGGDD